ncbi:hypothetical protein SAMN04488238_101655 [Roseicitreum antarcticum]|uniref:Uncharacterized protein n=1 Tax=Roseicitreum antarcticum TaxID=564137 RepID=A0A1H2SMR4_9RHOB|nr:hypothetical protein SAMN04488238_101655 [Roseicitreum antarcticum]
MSACKGSGDSNPRLGGICGGEDCTFVGHRVAGAFGLRDGTVWYWACCVRHVRMGRRAAGCQIEASSFGSPWFAQPRASVCRGCRGLHRAIPAIVSHRSEGVGGPGTACTTLGPRAQPRGPVRSAPARPLPPSAHTLTPASE